MCLATLGRQLNLYATLLLTVKSNLLVALKIQVDQLRSLYFEMWLVIESSALPKCQ